MIGEPLNDVACLELITEQAEDATETEGVRELAERFSSTAELARWLRALPQKNDDGQTNDGPRVPCDVPQRLRLPADDPNCVERSALYLSVAELIDPEPFRQLATIATPRGRHTFVVEDDLPVNLDPRVPRNALDAGMHRILGEPRVEDELEWILALAEEPAQHLINGEERLRNAETAITALRTGRCLPRNAVEDLGFAIAVADRAAGLFGDSGVDAVEVGSRVVRRLLAQRNAVALKIGDRRFAPDLSALSALGRIGSRLGLSVGAQLLKTKLGAWGIAPGLIGAVEKELNREGLSLGVLAAAQPPAGTLAALTTKALVQRKLLGSETKEK